MSTGLVAAVATAIAGLVFWRRKSLKQDALRAKETATSAVGAAAARVRGGESSDPESEGGGATEDEDETTGGNTLGSPGDGGENAATDID